MFIYSLLLLAFKNEIVWFVINIQRSGKIILSDVDGHWAPRW